MADEQPTPTGAELAALQRERDSEPVKIPNLVEETNKELAERPSVAEKILGGLKARTQEIQDRLGPATAEIATEVSKVGIDFARLASKLLFPIGIAGGALAAAEVLKLAGMTIPDVLGSPILQIVEHYSSYLLAGVIVVSGSALGAIGADFVGGQLEDFKQQIVTK